MNIIEFNKYWETEYPESFPICHELKWVYNDRWFRIHSLPESKRYADTEEEYQIIFNRQNKLINDIIGEENEIILVFGLYTNDICNDNYFNLKSFNEFTKIQVIDLHAERPEEFEENTLFDIYIKIQKWKNNALNDILKSIADEEICLMFVCPSKKCIVGPYDGGVDIILDTTENRDKIKSKYQDWLSPHENGL